MTNTKTTVTDSKLSHGEWMEVFADSSGAPAMLRRDGFHFACDFVGEVSVRCISSGSARKPSRKTVRIVTWRFEQLLQAHTTEAWRAASAELYSVEEPSALSSVNEGDDYDDERADSAAR